MRIAVQCWSYGRVNQSVAHPVDRCRRRHHFDHDETVIQSSPAFVGAVRVVDAISGWSVRVGAAASTDPDQRAALVDLFITTNGSEWRDNEGWKDHATGGDPCDNAWSGVTCNGQHGASNRAMYVTGCCACQCEDVS
jgi:hypothetical protein